MELPGKAVSSGRGRLELSLLRGTRPAFPVLGLCCRPPDTGASHREIMARYYLRGAACGRQEKENTRCTVKDAMLSSCISRAACCFHRRVAVERHDRALVVSSFNQVLATQPDADSPLTITRDGTAVEPASNATFEVARLEH
jgi:hypothetical protein